MKIDCGSINNSLILKGRKHCEKIRNCSLGAIEIAVYKQFLLLPQCFQKTFTADVYKPGLVWERVNASWMGINPLLPEQGSYLTLSQTSPGFYVSVVQIF